MKAVPEIKILSDQIERTVINTARMEINNDDVNEQSRMIIKEGERKGDVLEQIKGPLPLPSGRSGQQGRTAKIIAIIAKRELMKIRRVTRDIENIPPGFPAYHQGSQGEGKIVFDLLELEEWISQNDLSHALGLAIKQDRRFLWRDLPMIMRSINVDYLLMDFLNQPPPLITRYDEFMAYENFKYLLDEIPSDVHDIKMKFIDMFVEAGISLDPINHDLRKRYVDPIGVKYPREINHGWQENFIIREKMRMRRAENELMEFIDDPQTTFTRWNGALNHIVCKPPNQFNEELFKALVARGASVNVEEWGIHTLICSYIRTMINFVDEMITPSREDHSPRYRTLIRQLEGDYTRLPHQSEDETIKLTELRHLFLDVDCRSEEIIDLLINMGATDLCENLTELVKNSKYPLPRVLKSLTRLCEK